MSSAGQKAVLGVVEIVAGVIIDAVTEGTGGNWLITLGEETLAAAAIQELTNLLAPSPSPSAQNGIVRSSVASQQIVYGQVKTGGVITFSDSFGPNNEYLCVGVAHSLTQTNGSHGLGIEGVQAFYINDTEIPIAYWDSSTGNILTGPSGSAWNPLVGNLNIFFHDGSQTAVDATLNTNFPTEWPSTNVGKGICWTLFQMFDSSDQATFQAAYPQGIPSLLGVIIAGQKIYDPRQDSTNGGSGSQRKGTPSTWTFSSNPALIAANYLTRAKGDGGAGYSTSLINWPSVAAAANICDQNITTPQYDATWNGSSWSATQTVSRYTCNIGLNCANTVDQNLKAILDTMAGVVVAASGQIYLYAGNDDTSSGSIDETYLAGAVQLANQIQRQGMWNAVKYTYGQEAQADYTTTEAQPIYNSTYETQDGGVRLWYTGTLPGVTNQWNAQYLSIIQSQRSRNKMMLTMKCNLKALVYQAWDVVTVNIAELYLSNARFRITNYSLDSDMTVTMTLLQENSGTYTVALSKFVEYDVPLAAAQANTLWSPPAPTSLTVDHYAAGNLLQWVPPPPNYYQYQTVYRSTSPTSGYSAQAKVIGDSWTDKKASSGTTYYYYVTATNYLGHTSAVPSLPAASTTAKTAPVTTSGALDPITITSPTITGGTTSGTGISGGTVTGTTIDTTTTLGGTPVITVTTQTKSKSVNLLGADSSARKNLT